MARRRQRGGHDEAEVARDRCLADLQVLDALDEDEVLGALLGDGRLELGHARLQRIERAADLRSLYLLAPLDERFRIGVGGDLGCRGGAAGAVDVDDRVRARVHGGAVTLHHGRDAECGGRRLLRAHQGGTALLHVWAADDGGDARQIGCPRIRIDIGLPGQRIGHIERGRVHDLGGRRVHLRLSRGEEERRAGGDRDDEENQPQSPHDHLSVVA